MFKWGFVPHWAQDSPKMRPVNAKSETVASSPMFSESFRRRRCLVPADGFYEWTTVNKKMMPIHFLLKDKSLFGYAGIWDVWKGPEGTVFSCAILTTTPNELIVKVHDRMAVILRREEEGLWLDPAVEDPAKLQSLLIPYPAEEMVAVPVNPVLNKPSFEGPDCLLPPQATS